MAKIEVNQDEVTRLRRDAENLAFTHVMNYETAKDFRSPRGNGTPGITMTVDETQISRDEAAAALDMVAEGSRAALLLGVEKLVLAEKPWLFNAGDKKRVNSTVKIAAEELVAKAANGIGFEPPPLDLEKWAKKPQKQTDHNGIRLL